MSFDDLLRRAADVYGVELSYTDTWGKTHHTTPETLRTVLAALGVPCHDQAALELALAQREKQKWLTPLDPSLVVREHNASLELRIPASRKGTTLKVEMEWENGELEHHWFWTPELLELGAGTVDGVDYLAKRIQLGELRLGYHQLRVHWVNANGLETFAHARLIVCPERAKTPDRRMAGLAISLYGLRSTRNWGVGDFTDLQNLIAAFAPAGAAFIALNPLHALPNRQPYNISPYLPECALYRNYLYLDVEKVGPCAIDEEMQREIDALRASEFVEYERAARLKLKALAGIYQKFVDNGGSPEFAKYIDAQGQPLTDYAVYCALWEHCHAQDPDVWLWTQWPDAFRDPRSPEVAAFTREHSERVLFFAFLAWNLTLQAEETQAFARAQGMPIGLYHDLALATDRYGADLWARRPFYASDCKVGAPGDALAPHGQDWGFPPPNREAHKQDGYQLFALSIREAARAGGALRIDHVMRFFRLFWIPENKDARDGTYVKDYAQDLLGILALESVRGNFVVIGEDLGTVSGEVRHELWKTGILSYRVLWFERAWTDHENPGRYLSPGEYPEQAVATTTTHDLPTLDGFFSNRDIEARLAAGLADQDSYQRQLAERAEDQRRLREAMQWAGFPEDPINFVMATPSKLAVINQEDLTGETMQQNLPGSTWQYPNWQRKMILMLEEAPRLAREFEMAVQRSGRKTW